MRVVMNYASNTERAAALVMALSNSLLPTATEGEPRFIAIQAHLRQRGDILRLVDESVRIMVVSNGEWTRFSKFNNLDEGVVETDWGQCFNMT
jgi:hypothetical protein